MQETVEAGSAVEGGVRGEAGPEGGTRDAAAWLEVTALRTVLLVAGAGTLLYLLVSLGIAATLWLRLPPLLFAIACLWLARRSTFEHPRVVSYTFLLSFWVLATYGLYTGGGIFGTASYTLFLLIICAGFLGGARAVMVITPLTILSIVAIYLVERHGHLPDAGRVLAHPSMLVSLLVQVTAGGIFVGLASRTLMRLNLRTEAALARVQESEARLRAFYESAFEGIVLSREGVIIDLNQRAAEIAGYPAEELIGRQIAEMIPSDQIEEVRDRLRKDDGAVYEHDIFHASGERIPVRAQTRNLTIGGDRLRATVFEDLRKERELQAEEARLAARMRIAQRLEAVGTLAAGVAHEFNNLLAGILAYLDLAEMGLDEARARDLREARAVALRGRDLVQQLLVSARKSSTYDTVVDLGEVVRELGRMLRATLPKTVEIGVEAAAHCRVVGDGAALHQVLLNLAMNATHAMPGGRGHLWVRVSCRTPARGDLAGRNEVVVEVEDDGVGMDAQTREKCFEPFFTTKAPGEGTGMGLAVVHGIVQAHGGCIDVESAPGEGTRFVISLPATKAERQTRGDTPEGGAEAETPGDEEAAPRGQGEHVCFLDDESILAEAMARLLAHQGFEVEAFTDPRVALRTIREAPDRFDVLVSDYSMPQMNGLEVIQALRDDGIRLPVVLCSGNPDLLPTDRLSELEVHEILQKPTDARTLTRALLRLTDRANRHEPQDPR